MVLTFAILRLRNDFVENGGLQVFTEGLDVFVAKRSVQICEVQKLRQFRGKILMLRIRLLSVDLVQKTETQVLNVEIMKTFINLYLAKP